MKEDRSLHQANSATEISIARPSAVGRYSELPTDWRARVFGLSTTASLIALLIISLLATWRVASPLISHSPAMVVTLAPPASPPEEQQEVPDGPRQVEQEKRKLETRKEEPDPPPLITPQVVPLLVETAARRETSSPADPIPETTAPKVLPAPPASRMSNNADNSWEALLLAHLEKYRRYPPIARARRTEGTAFVHFRMSRQGSVLAVELIRSSGSTQLDSAAVETVHRAQPLPAIPKDRPDPLELTVPVEFYVRVRP